VQKEYLKTKDNFGCYLQQEICLLLAAILKIFMYVIMLVVDTLYICSQFEKCKYYLDLLTMLGLFEMKYFGVDLHSTCGEC
jgi:hypothetical protein